MFKKVLLAFFLSFLFFNLLANNIFNFNKNNEKIINYNHTALTNNYKKELLEKLDVNNEVYTYKSFFPLKEKTWGYYGRVLKYYYAMHFTIINNDLSKIKKSIIILGNDSNNALEFFIQNLIASIVNLSIYGATSDREFFAESFLKWLQTPDKLKDKSWEITNHFFVNIFPKIIKYPGHINAISKNNLTVKDNIINLIEQDFKNIKTPFFQQIYFNKNSNFIITNSLLSRKNLNINYQIKIMEKIRNQILKQFQVWDIYWNSLRLNVYLNPWNQLFRFKASDESIQNFKNFIISNKHFKNFEDLDEQLKNHTKDLNGYSQIWFSNIYNDLNNNFKKKFNKNLPKDVNFEKWQDLHFEKLKELTLLIYNMIYYFLENDLWVKNLISSIYFASDLYLQDSEKSVLGYTFTDIIKKNKILEETYIVILANSFLQKEYSFDYMKMWISSPEKFSTLTHEFAHALDNFGSKDYKIRDINFSEKTSYTSRYPGNIFAEKQPNYFKINYELLAFFIITSSLTVIYSIKLIYTNRKKQKEYNNISREGKK